MNLTTALDNLNVLSQRHCCVTNATSQRCAITARLLLPVWEMLAA